MSLRPVWLVLAFVVVVGCGTAAMTTDPNEPQTAKEKQKREAEASGETDRKSSKFAGWRYQGDRKDCFFVVGRKCFKSQEKACYAACKTKQCKNDGGAPATMICKKG